MATVYLYLDITIYNTMSRQNNKTHITSLAIRVLGLIRRNLRGSPRKL